MAGRRLHRVLRTARRRFGPASKPIGGKPMRAGTALVMLISLFVSMEVAAYIDSLPPGASRDRPQQQTGTAEGQPHRVDGAATSASSAGPSAAAGSVPHVAGAVGPERRFADVTYPKSTATGNGELKLATQTSSTGVVAGSTEMVEQRTARSTVYQNPDGTRTLRSYDEPAFVRRADGRFEPLDSTLNVRPDWRYAPKTAAPATFGRSATDVLATLDVGGARIGFRLDGAAAVPASVDGAVITYAQVRPGADVVLTTTDSGIKEDIVLHGPDAPTTWMFPLLLDGVTAEVDADSAEVVFRDAKGTIRGSVPAGWMVDDNIGPSGEGQVSTGVRYAIVPFGGGVALRMDLDAAWLHDPARKYPVRVDPSVRYGPTDDTFVSSRDYANTNNGSKDTLPVGTYNGGAEKSAAYLAFDNASAALHNKYILGASLNLYNYWSYSCQARPVTVYRVLQTWGAGTAKTWPGPAYDATDPIVTRSFAHGWTDCPQGAWEGFPIPAERMTKWVHNQETFWGFTVRASETDSKGWKRFASNNNSIANNRPFLDVNYADQGAKFQLLSSHFDPPVTTAAGSTFNVRVFNQGSATWSPGGAEKLSYRIFDGGGQQIHVQPNLDVPVTVPPGGSYDITLDVPRAPAFGTYSMKIDMAGPGGWFHDVYGSPTGDLTYVVSNAPPTIKGNTPANNSYVYTRRPTLSVDYYDPDNTPNARSILFKICNGTPEAPTGCQESGWTSSSRWIVPDGVLAWGRSSFWYVTVSDTQTTSPQIGPFLLAPRVAQPAVTSHLSTASESADLPGVDPQVGNYSGTVVDANVQVPGPALTVARTYNSQDMRRTGAFGAGWTTSLDQRLEMEPDGNVVVTLASGLTVRFGSNPDGTFAPPDGRNLTLVSVFQAGGGGYWVLRDSSGAQRRFTNGRLTSVTDADGRVQTSTYDTSGRLVKVTDVVSGRALTMGWTGGHVTSVATDPPVAGQSAPTWTYAYTGDDLTQVCSPLSAQSCVSYTYTPSSHYRSLVLDDGAAGYWPLSETSGLVASNVAARRPGELDATFKAAVVRGQPGALMGSPDQSARFADVDGSSVTLPQGLLAANRAFAFELWFRSDPGTVGPLLGQFRDETSPSGLLGMYNGAALKVNAEGKLQGGLIYANSSDAGGRAAMVSVNPVNDGSWHHAVLTGTDIRQELYLDGVFVDSRDGALDSFAPQGYMTVGMSRTGRNITQDRFAGLIDEVAFYPRPLGASAVAEHWAARQQTTRMTKVTEPGTFTASQMSYEPVTGRLTTLTDRNSANWTLSAPVLSNDALKIAITSSVDSAVTYVYDPFRGNRPVSRSTDAGTRSWQYNDAGFVSAVVDENGHTTTYDTDPRGNVIGRTTFRGGYHTTRFGYYLNAADKFDPRNDAMVWQADARSASETDTTYRTSYTLDTAGRVTTATYPVPAGQFAIPTETFTYSTTATPAYGGGTLPAGLLISSVARNGATTTLAYNSKGDLVRVVGPKGLATTYTRDALGRKTTEATAASSEQYTTTTYTYTPTGLLATETASGVTNPVTLVTHTRQTTNEYDASGRRTKATRADLTGGDANRVTAWAYDPAGRLISTHEPSGAITTHEWNALGDVTKTTKPSGLVLEYTYNRQHQVVETAATGAGVNPVDPNATRLVLESRAYDPAGRLGVVTDAEGRQTFYVYADDGLLTEVRRANTLATGGEGQAQPGNTTQVGTRAYDAAGNLTAITDHGRDVQYTYDAAGYVSTQAMPNASPARRTSYQHSLDGAVVRESVFGQDSSGTAMVLSMKAFAYDGLGLLTSVLAFTTSSVSGPSRIVATYQRDARGLVTQASEFGIATDYTYDATGALVTTTGTARSVWNAGVRTDDVRPVTTLGRNTFGEVTDHRDPLNAVTRAFYDAGGRLTKTELPAYTAPGSLNAVLPTYTLEYNADGQPTKVTDPLQRVSSMLYDRYGRQIAATGSDPDGTGPKVAPVSTISYTAGGYEAETVDPTGASRRSTWDPFGRRATLTATERTDSGTLYYTTTIGYKSGSDAVEPTSIATPAGGITTLSYDGTGQPLRITDPTGRFVEMEYDRTGHMIRQRQGRAGTPDTYLDVMTGFGYSTSMGETTVEATCATVDSANCLLSPYSKTTMSYGTNGLIATKISGEGRPTRYAYDAAGQLTSVTQLTNPSDEATAITVQLGYDAKGRHTRTVDGNNNATDYTYNVLDLPESTVEPATTAHPAVTDRTWTNAYDAAGQPVKQSLPGGVVRTRTYDGLGRLTGETGTGAEAITASRSLDYDANGRIVRMGGPNGDTTYTWNDRGLLTRSAGAAGNATFTYDGDRRMATRADAAGTASFTYDDAGRLLTAVDPLTSTTQTYTYESTSGQLANVQYGAGARRVYTYDAQDRQVAKDEWRKADGTVLSSTTFDRDKDGLLTYRRAGAQTAQNPGTTYAYDGLGRLRSTAAGSAQEAYTYDAGSNLLTTVVQGTGGTTTRTATYDQRNRLQSATSTGAQPGSESYTWSARGTLSTAAANGATSTYAFDAFERLTRAVTTGQTLDYTYDSLDRLAQRNGFNSVYDDQSNNVVKGASAGEEATLFRLPSGLATSSKLGTGAGQALLTDSQHGDGIATANPSTGAISGTASYGPMGQRTATGARVPVGYQGGVTDDATGMTNAAARWYSPTTRSFASRDTWDLEPDPVVQANRYLYANGAPTTFTDVNGHAAVRADGNGPWCGEDGYWDDDCPTGGPDGPDRRRLPDGPDGPQGGGGGGGGGKGGGGGGRGGGGGGGGKHVGHNPPPQNTAPRKPLGSEINQRPAGEDLNGGQPLGNGSVVTPPTVSQCTDDCANGPTFVLTEGGDGGCTVWWCMPTSPLPGPPNPFNPDEENPVLCWIVGQFCMWGNLFNAFGAAKWWILWIALLVVGVIACAVVVLECILIAVIAAFVQCRRDDLSAENWGEFWTKCQGDFVDNMINTIVTIVLGGRVKLPSVRKLWPWHLFGGPPVRSVEPQTLGRRL